jgi:hypothetical protein
VCKDKKRVFLGGSNVVSNAGACTRLSCSLAIPTGFVSVLFTNTAPEARSSLAALAAPSLRTWIAVLQKILS